MREVRFFHHIGRLGAHAQGTFHLLVRHLPAPPCGLFVEVVPIREDAAREIVIFCICKIPLDFSLPIGIADSMGNEGDPKDLAEPLHLGGDLGIGAAAVGHEDARIVDDAAGTGAVHKPEGGVEKDPCLEARIGRVVLDKELSGVGENQPGTLGLDFLSSHEHLVGGRIVLHLLARTKGIGARTLLTILPQIEVTYDPGQGAVRDFAVVLAFQDLLDPDGIALCGGEGLTDDVREILVGRLPLQCVLPFTLDHPLHGVSGDLQNLADLPDADSPLMKTCDGLLALFGNHNYRTS